MRKCKTSKVKNNNFSFCKFVCTKRTFYISLILITPTKHMQSNVNCTTYMEGPMSPHILDLSVSDHLESIELCSSVLLVEIIITAFSKNNIFFYLWKKILSYILLFLTVLKNGMSIPCALYPPLIKHKYLKCWACFRYGNISDNFA